jgi:hypothetical protein
MASSNRRLKRRLGMRGFSEKMRRAGWCQHTLWAHRDLLDALHARAKELDTTTRIIVLTALHIGLQRLRPSDVVAMKNRWHGLVSLPIHELLKRGLWKPKYDRTLHRIVGCEPVQRSA